MIKERWLLDCGALERQAPPSSCQVFLTHTHLDHVKEAQTLLKCDTPQANWIVFFF